MPDLRGQLSMGTAIALAVALVLGLALLARRPGDRDAVRNWLLLLAVCAVLEVATRWMGGEIATHVTAALTGLALIRLAAMFVFRVLLPAAHVHTARIVEDLAATALVVSWVFVLLRIAGVELTGMIATSAVVTAVLAFSMQETLGNVLGGIVLQLDRSIHAGDWLRVEDLAGRVVEIGWRHTAIETRGGEVAVVPNGWLMKNRFIVTGIGAAGSKVWRRSVVFHVDWAARPTDVCDTLERSIVNAGIAGVAATPPPSAILTDATRGFGTYALRYWLTDFRADDSTDSLVRIHALAALERRGFRLGINQEERILIKDNEAHREEARASDRRRRVEALGSVQLFAALTAAEREALAEHLAYAPFVAGDVMTRQGAVAHWLYLVVRGEADVWRETATGRQRVGELNAGSVFGEMGLLTGEPRRATVTARTDVVCYRLDKSGFETILRSRPDVAEEMSRVLSEREAELAARLAADAPGAIAPHGHGDILARMRRFFGI